MDMWFVSTFWLLWIVVLWTFVYTFLCGHAFLILSCMYLGIEFLGHNVLSCTMCLVMSDSVTPWTGTTRLFCPWDSLGKNTGVGSHCLLQGGSQWLELKHAGWGLHVGGHEGPHVMLQLREEWEGRKGSLGTRAWSSPHCHILTQHSGNLRILYLQLLFCKVAGVAVSYYKTSQGTTLSPGYQESKCFSQKIIFHRLLLIQRRSFCSVTRLCLTLCDPMDCSLPGFPVLHYLQEFAQTHDAI